MDSDGEKEVHEPLLKRQKLEVEEDGAATASKLSSESYYLGNADSGSSAGSPGQPEGGEVDHESIDSGDDFSELSNLSGLDDQCNEASWLPVAGPISWVQHQMSLGKDPRELLHAVLGDDFEAPPEFNQLKLWEMLITLMLESTERTKLSHINTLQDVVGLLNTCKNIIVLTGAGVSVSCGIPDFRSQDGIYARLAKDFPNLPNPQSMFDINFFKSDQRPFFKFAKEIYPGQFEPSPCHKFIRLLETHGKLLRNYTQNIDTLEKVAGVERAIECHGSFATATCMVCKYKVDKEAVRKDIFDQVIPRCPQCGPDVEDAVMKPDIVFFGESLPDEFHKQMRSDKDVCDLLIVIGSSLKVRPVSRIPSSLPAHVPQIIINREPLNKQYTFDVELLGNCDDVISELCKRLGEGWHLLAKPGPQAEEIDYNDLPPKPPALPSHPAEVLAGGGREDVVEHSADSGLGDLETVTQACGSVLYSGSTSASSSSNDSHSTKSSDRLQRLSSSDSGTESGTAIDTHRLDTVQSQTAVSSKPCSDDGVSSTKSLGQNYVHDSGSSCVEVSAQSNCMCSQNQEYLDTTKHICHSENTSDSAEGKPSQSVDYVQDTALSPHFSHRQYRKSTEVRESLSTCEGPIVRNRHPYAVHSADSENDKKDGFKDARYVPLEELEMQEMREIWERRKRQSIACRCKENQIIFVSPNRYIFPGAEVYSDDEDSDSDDGSHLSISPIPEEPSFDADESHDMTNSRKSPPLASSKQADSQSCSGHMHVAGSDMKIGSSPCSTPPSSPFTASDDGLHECTKNEQDRSAQDTVSVSSRGVKRTRQ